MFLFVFQCPEEDGRRFNTGRGSFCDLCFCPNSDPGNNKIYHHCEYVDLDKMSCNKIHGSHFLDQFVSFVPMFPCPNVRYMFGVFRQLVRGLPSQRQEKLLSNSSTVLRAQCLSTANLSSGWILNTERYVIRLNSFEWRVSLASNDEAGVFSECAFTKWHDQNN